MLGVFGVGGAGAPGPAGPAGPAGAGGVRAPAWDWLDRVGVEGVDTNFNLANWQQSTAGALSPVALTPTLAADSKSIALACPSGYGAFIRPQAMAVGSDVCFRVQTILASATNLTIGIAAEVHVGAFESAAAATQWAGAGPRFNSAAIFSTNPTLSVRGQANAVTGISDDGVIGAEATVPGTIFSQAFCVRLRRTGAVINFYIAESFSGWKLVATPPEATLDAALAGLHVGIRWQGTAAQQVIISGYHYAAGGVV